MAYDKREQNEVLREFTAMLRAVTADGGRKRKAGLKPSWKIDRSHRAAIFSHLNKYEHGERTDVDSGQHPYVHLAWRALAIAWQDTHPNEVHDLWMDSLANLPPPHKPRDRRRK